MALVCYVVKTVAPLTTFTFLCCLVPVVRWEAANACVVGSQMGGRRRTVAQLISCIVDETRRTCYAYLSVVNPYSWRRTADAVSCRIGMHMLIGRASAANRGEYLIVRADSYLMLNRECTG